LSESYVVLKSNKAMLAMSEWYDSQKKPSGDFRKLLQLQLLMPELSAASRIIDQDTSQPILD
jgi:hypothetical protein